MDLAQREDLLSRDDWLLWQCGGGNELNELLVMRLHLSSAEPLRAPSWSSKMRGGEHVATKYSVGGRAIQRL